MRLLLVLLAALTFALHGAEPLGRYEAATRTLTVPVGGQDRFRYVFNPGGAISGIFDLAIAPEQNLIGPSFQGETTDRVLQWTYWNGRYRVPENPVGDHDRRANVTMEGCFAEQGLCEVEKTPATGDAHALEFRSRIRHWFYANLDAHGRPDFTTRSRYEILAEGSLRLTRRVTRAVWPLQNIEEQTKTPTGWQTTLRAHTTMVCEHYGARSQTSYFEAWCPFRWETLPHQKHAHRDFSADGYQFWSPADLGGWAMAYGERQAVAIVFGLATATEPHPRLEPTFNKLLQPKANLNILLPAIQATWPEGSTLSQTLIIVPGTPAEVEQRAQTLASQVPAPTVEAGSPP